MSKSSRAKGAQKTLPEEISEDTPSSLQDAQTSQNVEKHSLQHLVLLMDDALAYEHTQQELLAVAEGLRDAGFTPHILCIENSPLMTQAQEKNFTAQPLRKGFTGLLRLLWRYKRELPLCVHSFSSTCAHIASKLVAWRKPGATLTLHSNFVMPQNTQDVALSLALKAMDTIIHASKCMATAWEEAELSGLNAKVVYTAFDAQCVAMAKSTVTEKKTKQGLERCNFVVVSDVFDEDDIDAVFKSIPFLHEQNKTADVPFEIRLVGKVASFEASLTRARGLGIEEQLAFLGEQHALDVLSSATIVILLPGDCQKCIAPLMASFCLGLPVIATEIVPYTEFKQGNMLFVAPHEQKALHEAMLSLMGDDKLRERHAQHSAELREFASMPRLQEEYVSIYKELLDLRAWPLPKADGTVHKKTLA